MAITSAKFGDLEVGQEFYEAGTAYRKESMDRGDKQGWAVELATFCRVSFAHSDRVWI